MIKKLLNFMMLFMVLMPAFLRAEDADKVIGTINGIRDIVYAYLPDRELKGPYPQLIPTKKVYDAIHSTLPNYQFGTKPVYAFKRTETHPFFAYQEEMGEEIKTLDDAKAWIMLANCGQLVAEGKNNESWNGNLLTDTPRFVDLKKVVTEIRKLFPTEKSIQGTNDPQLPEVKVNDAIISSLGVHVNPLIDIGFPLSTKLQEQLDNNLAAPYRTRVSSGDPVKHSIGNIFDGFPNELKFDTLPFAKHMLIFVNLLDLYAKGEGKPDAFANFDGDILTHVPEKADLKTEVERIRALYPGVDDIQVKSAKAVEPDFYTQIIQSVKDLRQKMDDELKPGIADVDQKKPSEYSIEDWKSLANVINLAKSEYKNLPAMLSDIEKKSAAMNAQASASDPKMIDLQKLIDVANRIAGRVSNFFKLINEY